MAPHIIAMRPAAAAAPSSGQRSPSSKPAAAVNSRHAISVAKVGETPRWVQEAWIIGLPISALALQPMKKTARSAHNAFGGASALGRLTRSAQSRQRARPEERHG